MSRRMEKFSAIFYVCSVIFAIFLSSFPVFAAEGKADEPEFVELCATGSLEAVRRAVEAGAEPNEPGARGILPLSKALGNPDPAVMRFLLDAGADPNARVRPIDSEADRQHLTPLHMAVMVMSRPPGPERPTIPYEHIRILLDAGADINSSSYAGTPLLVALIFPSCPPELVEFLISHGADVNARGMIDTTALIEAARHNVSNRIVRLLIESGADVDARDESGATPLVSAILSTGLMTRQYNDPLKTIDLLIAAGCDTELRADLGPNESTLTPLMCAALMNNLPAAQRLVAAGADLAARNDNGDTAYRIAARAYMGDVAPYLFFRGNRFNLWMATLLYAAIVFLAFFYAVQKRRFFFAKGAGVNTSIAWTAMLIIVMFFFVEGFSFWINRHWRAGYGPMAMPMSISLLTKLGLLLPQASELLFQIHVDSKYVEKRPLRKILIQRLPLLPFQIFCLLLMQWSVGRGPFMGE